MEKRIILNKDYYELLGLSSGASPDQISKAYKQKALKCHPDKNQGAPEEAWAEISHAHKVLSDPKRKQEYDNYGEEGVTEQVLEIDLAYRTLQLEDDKVKGKEDNLRSLVANLCDFQFYFAAPIQLPFGIGDSLQKSHLKAPKPFYTLKRFQVLCPISADQLNTADARSVIVDPEDPLIYYALVGQPLWVQFVQSRAIEGPQSADPKITVHEWLSDLFQIFESISALPNDAPLRNDAQRLAPCWLHVATQLYYGFDGNEEENSFDASELMESVSAGLGVLLGGGNESESFSTSSGSEDASQSNENSQGEESDSAEEDDEQENPKSYLNCIYDEEEESSDSDFEPEEGQDEISLKRKREPSPEQDSHSKKLKTEGALEEPEETTPPERKPIDPLESNLATLIFRVIEKLGSYMPDPEADLLWFKRVLKSYRSVEDDKHHWYPWGCPPLEPLVNKVLKAKVDKNATRIARSIVKLFQEGMEDIAKPEDAN